MEGWRRRILVGIVAWSVAVVGGSAGVHLLLPFQPMALAVGIVVALAVIAPFFAMRFVPSAGRQSVANLMTFLFAGALVAVGLGINFFNHWHDRLAIANDSDQDIAIFIDGHDIGTLEPHGVGSVEIPTGASELAARHGDTVVDRDTFIGIFGDGMWLFDVGGTGCFERRSVTYSSRPQARPQETVTHVALEFGHHMLRTAADFAWHSPPNAALESGTDVTREVLVRCGADD